MKESKFTADHVCRPLMFLMTVIFHAVTWHTVIALLLLVSLFFLSGTVFAVNWVYFAKGNNPRYGNCNTYVDKDTVVKNGNNVTFWEQDILDNVDQSGGKKYLFRIRK
jgi:hypothetical protein